MSIIFLNFFTVYFRVFHKFININKLVITNIINTFIVALQKKRIDTNSEACDMWSFAILLWELATREIPFSHLSPMEIGMKV